MATRRTPRAKTRPGAKRPGLPRTTVVLRWCIVGVAVFVAFLYYQPLSSYLETRSALNERAAEVQRLREERTRLQARLADSETVTALAREARRMRLVRPGERIFIVKGVAEWRRAQRRTSEGRRWLRSAAMDDRALVEQQLGRPPRAFRRVAARCPGGAPAVTEQWPYDDAGDPFPTTYYLTCPHLVAAIARIEAAGGVERWSEEVEHDPELAADLERATDEQRRIRRELAGGKVGRDGGSSLELGIGGSGNPRRLKCLHAHAAYALAQPGYLLGERILAELDPRWPPQLLPRIADVITEAEVESARREWEEGYRRLHEEARRESEPRAAARAGRHRRSRAPATRRRHVHARRAGGCVRGCGAVEPRGRLGAVAGARAGRGRSRSSRRRPSTSMPAAPRTTSREHVARAPAVQPMSTSPRRPRPRRQQQPLLRPALAVLGLLALLLLGISIGRALEDGPNPGGTQTNVRTLTPQPLPPAERTVTVTVTTG